MGPTMLRDTFPALLGKHRAPASESVWESSRFGLDFGADHSKSAGGVARATYELFAGMIEFGLSRRLTDIVTVTDARMERILGRAHWPLRRISEPKLIGKTMAVAGYLEVSPESLACVRQIGGLLGPVICNGGDRIGRSVHSGHRETGTIDGAAAVSSGESGVRRLHA
jgi:acyl homoserine lactone synthase